MTICAYHVSLAMSHACMGWQNALMLHISVYHSEEVTSMFFSMHFTQSCGQKNVSNEKKLRWQEKIDFFNFFHFFLFLQKSLLKRPMRPTSNRGHSSGQWVQRALQSDHFCSYNRVLNIYFGKISWRRKKHFRFLELWFEKMKKNFAFSKTSRSGKSNLSSRDVFGFLIFKFPMQNHNSK